MMTQNNIILRLRQGSRAADEHQLLMVKHIFAGMLILAGLTITQVARAEEKTADIPTKLTALIKDIANMRELEATTFHVINITEHESVLPAELRLAGKESDWADGVVGYVEGKEVLTGLIPGANHIRLMVCVPLKPREAKKVTFKKGKSAAATDLKVEQAGARVIVSNGQAKWELGPNGLEQFQRSGKTFGLKETGIANGTLKTTMTPAVCRVLLSAESALSREYLFYPNSALWQVDADKKYQLMVDGTNAFYYMHPSTAFFGDPGSPYGAVIETSELEKGGAGIKGLKEFHLFSAADWGLLMGKGIGLGIYPNPDSHTILVDTTKCPQGVVVQAVPIDERSNAIFKKWHWGMEVERMCGCGWWRTKAKPLGDRVSYVFGAATEVQAGNVQRSESLPPLALRALGDRLHGAQLPWITDSRSETISVEDLDGNGPDMLNDRWSWCVNGKPMSRFEFHDTNKDGLLNTVEIYAKWGDSIAHHVPDLQIQLANAAITEKREGECRALDAMESKHPVLALHDQTGDGKIVANCVFFGGRIDQDWFECHGGFRWPPPNRETIEKSLKEYKFNHSIHRALDLDGDGDWDVTSHPSYKKEPETDYDYREGKYGSTFLDLYDNNPFHGFLIDPFTGDCAVKFGFHWPCYLGHICVATFRYKGVPVVGQDAVVGNIDLDGDGLPEAKLIYDGGFFDDDFVFRPVQNMIGSSLSLSDRHALSKINSWVWQEGPGCQSCYKRDITVYPIRKNAGFPWGGMGLLFNDRLMPKRPIKDSITTYRDKWGNEIKIVGIMQIPGWDGKLVAGSKTPSIVKDWSDSMHYDWDYMFVLLGGGGVMTESGYPNHSSHWEFCPDYARYRKTKLFYSELDGRLHLTGAAWGHDTPWMGVNPKKPPLDEFAKCAHWWLHSGYSCLDCDTMRYYARRHEAFFDTDHDGYLDCFLVDTNNNGWYENRAWYDRESRTVACLKDGILIMAPHQLEPYPEAELLIDEKSYDKLVALKKMSEEKSKTSYLKATSIKAQPLSVSVPASNLWVGLDGDLLPQVLLDTAHGATNIWGDLSPKGYSRLLTGLQRQKTVVRELKEKWSNDSLRGATVLFMAPPFTVKPDADELKALDAFLKAGGRIVLALPDWSTEPQGEIYALKASVPLIPNGKTGDWAGPLSMDLALKWEEPEPYRVKITVCPRWDKKHFYLYAEVHDQDLINKETGGLIWKDDSIQFALGDLGVTWQDFTPGMGDAEGLTGVVAKGGIRQEYGIARTDKGAEVYRWIDVPGNRTGPVAGAKLQVTRESKRTLYQLALPWAEVSKTDVQAGTTLGFALWVWDRSKDNQVQRMTMGNIKRPDQFRKLIFVDTPDAANKYADTHGGMPVESPLDEICASYGIRRNNEHTALVAVIDPHFRNRGMGPEVWEKFKGCQSDVIMKDVRKLFFNGSSLNISGSAAPLVQYQDKIIGARAKVGKGELLVFCSEMMLNNKCSCFHAFAFEGGDCSPNEKPLDKLIDAKPDNNIFMDNLGAYLVAGQTKFKVLKADDNQTTIKLTGPGKVYVSKGTKATLDGKEIADGKETGDVVCFDVPAPNGPAKLEIER